LYVAPEFFIHKWRRNPQREVDLMIEVPADFDTRVMEEIAKKD